MEKPPLPAEENPVAAPLRKLSISYLGGEKENMMILVMVIILDGISEHVVHASFRITKIE